MDDRKASFAILDFLGVSAAKSTEIGQAAAE